MPAMAVIGVDVGGTFTDAVLLADGRLHTAKVPTGPEQERSVVEAARLVLDAACAPPLERFAHGTTVATNALLERKGARTAFVATRGFEHLLHLRRQDRAHLYRLDVDHPEPLVPLERCVGVDERIGPDGVVTPLDLSSLPEIDAEAVAVCLLFSFRDASHEQAVAAELRRRHPGTVVVASHEVAPEFREYERASTTTVDAYLGPLTARYLTALGASAAEAGLPSPAGDALVRRGRDDRRSRGAPGADPPLGPCGGGRGGGARRRRERRRERDRLRHGRHLDRRLPDRPRPRGPIAKAVTWPGSRSASRWSTSTRSGQAAARLPGGTEVAPCASARGARAPFPGRPVTAGVDEQATVTDANLLLGRLPERLPGGLELDRDAAARALGDIDPSDVVDIVNAEMLRALRVVSVERGHDPRDFALVAFGGAGPLHACALAEELGCAKVLVPDAAGVLSALGLVASDDASRPGSVVRRSTRRGG